jgi:beta-alanine--pyruvate transaminase
MVERVKALAPYFENAVHGLKGVKHITDIRNYGLAAGFTIASRTG